MTQKRVTSAAPGRVNLMGDHTDYNLGFVLPMPIPQQTRVQLVARPDQTVHVQSKAAGLQAGEFRLGSERLTKSWIDYVQGVTSALRERGHRLGGFEASFESEVPVGAGLSSSAALEVALLRGLRELFQLSIDDAEIAQLGRAAEVSFVGVPVGIMDQMASSVGKLGSALFLDTRSLAWRNVAIPEQLEVVVIDSGVTHSHEAGEYRVRRAECERAAQLLGVSSLRELEDLSDPRLGKLDELLLRRTRHVITENARVLATARALEAGDGKTLGETFAASHASLRDDYQVSVPPLDLLVELGGACRGILGARLTGGGFGGAVVMLAERGRGAPCAAAICAEYTRRTGSSSRALLPL